MGDMDESLLQADKSTLWAKKHDKLIGTILAEEEELINAHKQHIEFNIRSAEREMEQLQVVDRPGSDVEAYGLKLAETLRKKKESIEDLEQKLSIFLVHLREETEMSEHYKKQQKLFAAATALLSNVPKEN